MTEAPTSLRDRIARALVDAAHDFGHGEAVVVDTSTAADAVLAVIGVDLARLAGQTEQGTDDQLCTRGSRTETNKLSSPEEVVHELVGLLRRSGWQRLEAWRSSPTARPAGYCVDATGRSVHVGDVTRSS